MVSNYITIPMQKKKKWQGQMQRSPVCILGLRNKSSNVCWNVVSVQILHSKNYWVNTRFYFSQQMPGLLFQKPTIILDTPWQVNKSAGFALGMLAFSQKIRHAPVLYGMLYFKLLRYKTKLPPKALAFQKFYSLYTFVCTQQNTSSSALCFMMYPPLKKPRAGVNSRQLTVMMNLAESIYCEDPRASCSVGWPL